MENKILQPKTGKLRLHEDVELPIDGLPLFVQEYINEIVRVYHCPREFPTVAVFSVIASAIGKRVKVTDHKYTNPLMLWFVNVAISGSNKTQPVKEVLRPLREINRENYEAYEREYELWKADKDRDENNPPSFNQLLVGDCTEEARIKILQNSSHGVLGHYPEVKVSLMTWTATTKAALWTSCSACSTATMFLLTARANLSQSSSAMCS